MRLINRIQMRKIVIANRPVVRVRPPLNFKAKPLPLEMQRMIQAERDPPLNEADLSRDVLFRSTDKRGRR